MDDFSFFLNNKIGGDHITFKYRYRKQILIGILTTIVIIGIALMVALKYSKITKKTSKNEEPLIKENPIRKKKTQKKEPDLVKVDIKGAINSPGIYSLDTNSRVVDVIEKAGGLTENADTSVINLSKKIADEMVIIIYTRLEVQNFKVTKEKESEVQKKCIQKDENALKNDACITNSEKISNKISLNTASVEELMTLNGIGESKAKEIISYREKNGPFTTIEDLIKVPGIGENTLAQIKKDITV